MFPKFVWLAGEQNRGTSRLSPGSSEMWATGLSTTRCHNRTFGHTIQELLGASMKSTSTILTVLAPVIIAQGDRHLRNRPVAASLC
jgi:hypothetical protein